MAKSRTLRGLIALIESAGGRIDARIKVQKEAFLLAASNVGDFDQSDFAYHHYGPYSREISDALQFSVSSGLLSEDKEPGASEGIRYSYTITNEGQRFLSEAGRPAPEEAALVQLMVPYHWRALELAATIRFLELRKYVAGRNEALAEAVRLKPDTRNYQIEASELLSKIAKIEPCM
jgi:uncharacterized protein